MSAIDKKEIRMQIMDLEESHCQGCTRIAKWRREIGNYQAGKKCLSSCRIGQRIKRLGDVLTYGKPVRSGEDLTEDEYLELREQGIPDYKIAEMHGVSRHTLLRRKQHWNLIEDPAAPKWNTLTIEQYQKYREDGISDELIAQLLGWDRKTLVKFKKRHGLLGLTQIHKVTRTLDGKEITPDLYREDLLIYKKDAALARAWGVNISTFERMKRRWRENGQI